MGFWVKYFRFRVQGSGWRVEGLGSRFRSYPDFRHGNLEDSHQLRHYPCGEARLPPVERDVE